MDRLNGPLNLNVAAWRCVLVAISVHAISACGGGGGGNETGSADSQSPPPPPPPPTVELKPFSDATTASNVAYIVDFTPPGGALTEPLMSYGGAAAGDCDADGDIDLFITYGDRDSNRLYLNQWDAGSPLLFTDNAEAAGVAGTRPDGHNDRHSGPVFADMDGDGDLDLFIGGVFDDPNKIYRNLGDCTFEDATYGSGIEGLTTIQTVSAGFGDYDLDGDLDLFLAHWGSWNDSVLGGETQHLFRNISSAGEIRFENVSLESRVTEHLLGVRPFMQSDFRGDDRRAPDWTLTPMFARINDDLWPDLLLASDYNAAQLLLGDPAAPGTFLDATSDAVHDIDNAMGSTLGDFDFDGDLDWFVTSIYFEGSVDPRYSGNRLFENPGGDFSSEQFVSITDSAGVTDGGWGWAACMIDIDNDTDLDIYHTNGWEQAGIDVSRAFINDGTGVFTDKADELGLNDRFNARGAVCADFDNDGDIDILQLTSARDNSAALWHNDTAAAGNNFLRVQLLGLPPNTEAAGARIFATIGSKTQMREVIVGSNYTSQVPTIQVFGLDTATSIDELRVEWPALWHGTGDEPTQPDEWMDTDVPAGLLGETLVICHPELTPAPADCAAGN